RITLEPIGQAASGQRQLKNRNGKNMTLERSFVTPADPDDFEHWLYAMDDALQRFISDLDESIALKLDYSEKSLETIESLILKQYTSVERILIPEESYRLDGLARYIGEIFAKQSVDDGKSSWMILAMPSTVCLN
ncbi:MAG: hypothetical protein KBC66_11560, partial [Kiritimatiellae bacterium]|nr:hypothetical protein [Kiritimatiellia bacterium]